MDKANAQQKLETPSFQISYLSPRYWTTWCLFFLLWIIHWFPRKWIMYIGAWVGDQMRLRNRKRRDIVETNLQLCFPALNQTERDGLLVEHYRFFGATLVDMGTIWWASSKKLDKIVRYRDKAGYEKTINRNRAVLFTPHVVAIDAGGVAISKISPVVSMMKRDKNELFTLEFYRSRTRFNSPFLVMRDQGLRHLIAGIRADRVCYYIPDEDFGDTKYTEFAPFFDVNTSTLTMLGRICKLSRAVAIPCITILNRKVGHYEFIHGNPLIDFPTSSALEDAARMNSALENMIRLSPEQYMWTLKWFKTRPSGQISPYA